MPTEYDIAAAFEAIENELIASMMRNMKRHRAEEDAEGIRWSQWQAEQLQALSEYKRHHQAKCRKQFRSINRDIETLLREAKRHGGMEQEEAILRAIRQGATLRPRETLDASFFRVNERKLDALIKATTDDIQRAETAILRRANDQYRKIIFNAQVYANTGAGTYEKAVDMAAKDFLSAGIQCVVYSNGARHTLSDYAEMAIRTASKRAYLQGEGEKRQEWGISTVILNKRGNACPLCAPFCGKVFIDDVWSGGKATDGPYPLLSGAIAKGLYHPRCKDSHTTFFPEINEEGSPWTAEEREKLVRDYNREQKRQHVERQAKKYDRLSKYSLDEENRRRYAARSDEWDRVKNFSQFTDMLEDFNNGQNDIISHYNIQRNMNRSEIGRETMKYLLEHPEIKIEIFYNVDSKPGVFGQQIGDEIFIFASETKTVQQTTETIIHEVTHHRYNIGGTYWAECVCRAQEYKHRLNQNQLTYSQLRSIIKEIKDAYHGMRWR